MLVTRSVRAAYDADGALAEDTLRLWGQEGRRADRLPSVLPNEEIVQVCDTDVVWGGPLVTHYGHFLTESVARLWPLLPGGELEGLPVVFSTPGRQHVRPSHIDEWLAAFGVQTVELPPRGTVRFTRMFVPQPAWRVNGWIAPEMRAIHLKARHSLDVPIIPKQEVLWLSRLGLRLDRVPRDEALLEWLLRGHVAVIKPELLTISEQIAALEASGTVIGVVGSAFHTMLMSAKPSNCIYLCPSSVASTFFDQDRLLNIDGTFAQTLAVVRGAHFHEYRFPGTYRLLVPEILRMLSATILPGLREDSRIRAVCHPERYGSTTSQRRLNGGLEEAVIKVLLDPLAIEPRMELGAMFEAEDLTHCALEQFTMVADLTDDYPHGALRSARLLHRAGRLDEASSMATRALAIDPSLGEAAGYVDPQSTAPNA